MNDVFMQVTEMRNKLGRALLANFLLISYASIVEGL